MKALPDDNENDVFEFARGAHVGVVKPEEGFEPRLETSWHDFVKLVTEFSVSDSKVGTYVCRPMGNDGARSDANALPWPLLPLDLDELLPEDAANLERWCTQGPEVVLTTTFSHTPENPRIRLWIKCNRPFTAQEHIVIFRAFNHVAVFPFKLDPAMAKPSQPIYLPRCSESRRGNAVAEYYPGKALDVDGLLKALTAETEALKRRNEGGRFLERGVRVAGGVIDCFNKNFKLHALLEAHGYVRKSRSRYRAPGSKSGRAAVLITESGKVISFHDPAHDLLAQHNDFHQPRLLDPFGVFALLEHEDDFVTAWRAASRMVKQQGWEPDDDPDEAEDDEEEGGRLSATRVLGAKQAMDELPPKEMLVTDLLEEGALVLVTGRSNSGKTTILQYLALCVATGRNFDVHECSQGPVLWIAGEDAYNARLRLGGMCLQYGIDIDMLQRTGSFFIVPEAVKILDKASMKRFRKGVKKYVGANARFALVCVDSKSTCWGGENENSNDETAWFLEELRDLGTEFGKGDHGASMLLTHHLSKGSGEDGDEPTARGASALINNIDNEWRCAMNATSTIAKMEPGSKLRIARWKEIRFGIGVYQIPEEAYPRLRNRRGDMPKISIVEIGKPTGGGGGVGDDMTAADQSERVKILVALRDGLLDDPVKAKAVNEAVAGILEPELSEKSLPANRKAAANRARDLLRKMRGVKESLLDRDNKITRGGHRFLEQYQEIDGISDRAELEEKGEPEEK